jgi:lipoprotein NlpI
MNISEYICRLHQEMDSKKYNDCVPLLYEYKNYLEKEIESAPNNVVAACQLAAVYMELRMDTESSTDVLEKVLRNYGDNLSDEEKARLYTNLAYYYEDYGDLKSCRGFLEKAVALSPKTPNVYDALGRLYSANGNLENALSLFRTSSELGCELKYQYNFSVSLYQNGRWQEAKENLEKLLLTNKNNPSILYGLGLCCHSLNDKESAVAFAKEVIKYNEHEDVNESQIADLFYLCGEYALHNAMYDNCAFGYYLDASWLGPYFYCLNTLGKTNELVRKFDEVVSEKNQNISDWENKTDPDYSDEDRQERIQSCEKEKAEIETVYHKIVTEGFRPEVKINLDFIYGCYLIDCPRHQKYE